MHPKKIITAGKPAGENGKALIMLHGRGASADDIMSLVPQLNVDDFTIIAPEAESNTWYPYSFLSPLSQNEPWLSDAINMIEMIVQDLHKKAITPQNIFFLGFSQGACLALEYAARKAKKYGGVTAFTGGLIGDRIKQENYLNSLENTPVFIGSSDIDPHVPIERIRATSDVLKKQKADLTVKIYENMGHIINNDEIEAVNSLIFK